MFFSAALTVHADKTKEKKNSTNNVRNADVHSVQTAHVPLASPVACVGRLVAAAVETLSGRKTTGVVEGRTDCRTRVAKGCVRGGRAAWFVVDPDGVFAAS